MASVAPASFRGVPFAVRSNRTEGGRRQAIHEYPGRDGSFPEDLGRRGRRYRIQGFIVSDDAVYGGGPVLLQQQAILAAAEQAGSGLLIHPTLGLLTVSCESVSFGDDLGAATSMDVEWSFLEYTTPSLFGISLSTVTQMLAAAVVVDAAISTAFTASTEVGLSGSTTSAQWSAQVQAGGQDATALVNLASQLQGPYGRFFAGANSGYLGVGSGSVYAGDQTVASLAQDAALARSAITAASGVVATDFLSLSAATAPQTASDAQALVASLVSAFADPGDALRILTSLAGFVPSGSFSTAVSDLYRRSIVNAAARVATTYQPSSYNDAVNVQNQVTGLIDNEISIAGDEGDDADYNAFCALRTTVVADLQARGGKLAALETFTIQGNMPALYLAERLYGDASRADQLITQIGMVNPLFAPVSFEALAS
jgi:prophage DNA circulation protein